MFEYLDGCQPLDQVFARRALPRAAAPSVARQILEGLAYIHSRGVLHRDLKPGNVLLDTAGQATLIDLGLARQVTADETRHTQEGQVLGTLAYMPPEQILGEDPDERSDLYAAALIVYELLAGRLVLSARETRGQAPLAGPCPAEW